MKKILAAVAATVRKKKPGGAPPIEVEPLPCGASDCGRGMMDLTSKGDAILDITQEMLDAGAKAVATILSDDLILSGNQAESIAVIVLAQMMDAREDGKIVFTSRGSRATFRASAFDEVLA